jgi:hypothetical protein
MCRTTQEQESSKAEHAGAVIPPASTPVGHGVAAVMLWLDGNITEMMKSRVKQASCD